MEAPDPIRTLEMARAAAAAGDVGTGGEILSPERIEALDLPEPPRIHATHAGDPTAALVLDRGAAVVVAFRGTLGLPLDEGPGNFRVALFDWLNDARHRLVPAASGQVRRGFLTSLEAILDPLVDDLNETAGGKPLFLTGHGQGGALAALAAVELSVREGIAVAGLHTFGAPRPGDADFASALATHVPDAWRVERAHDPIPHLPPTGGWWALLGAFDDRLTEIVTFYDYAPAGRLAFLAADGSVRPEGDPPIALEATRNMALGRLLIEHEFLQLKKAHDVEAGYLEPLRALVADLPVSQV